MKTNAETSRAVSLTDVYRVEFWDLCWRTRVNAAVVETRVGAPLSRIDLVTRWEP